MLNIETHFEKIFFENVLKVLLTSVLYMFGSIGLFLVHMKFFRIVPHSNILFILVFQTICHLLLLLEIWQFHSYFAVQNNQRATSYCSAEMLCHIHITVKAALTENGYFATLLYFIRTYKYIFGGIGLFLGHLKFFRIVPYCNILFIIVFQTIKY